MFYVNVPVCLLALLLAYRGISDNGQREVRRLDLLGLALLSPAVALLVFGLSQTGTSGRGRFPLAAGAVLLVAFIVHALRTPAPLIDIRLFTHRALATASALNFMSRLSIFGALILIPLYYQQVRGHNALTAGLLLAPQSLGTMLALPYAGAIAYTQVTSHTRDLVLAAALLVWDIGIAAVVVPVSAAAYQGLPPTMIPSATSAIIMIQTVGASAGAAALATILQTVRPTTPAHRPLPSRTPSGGSSAAPPSH